MVKPVELETIPIEDKQYKVMRDIPVHDSVKTASRFMVVVVKGGRTPHYATELIDGTRFITKGTPIKKGCAGYVEV